MNFAKDCHLTDKGVIVDMKLNRLRGKMFKANPSLNIGNWYKWLPTLLESPLYDCFKHMPKPAIHHAHLTACATVDFLL